MTAYALYIVLAVVLVFSSVPSVSCANMNAG